MQCANRDITEIACPACNDRQMSQWFTKINSFAKFPIWRCSACKSGFVLPRPGKAVIESYYEDEAYRKGNASTPAERLEQLLEAERQYPNSTLDAARMIRQARGLAKGKGFLDVGGGTVSSRRQLYLLGLMLWP